MRFISEFNILNYRFIDRVPSDIQKAAERDLGKNIGKSFGWENPNAHQYKLEIEAFPMDKWIEFKNELFVELSREDTPNQVHILKLIKELESFGKPSGDVQYFLDTKENKLYRDNGDGKIEDITNPK